MFRRFDIVKKNLKVSVITVVRNGAQTIERTIQSVLKQKYNFIEYIIIDGNSTDGTQTIINKYIDRISYFVSEPDNGIYDGMNKGILKSTGDIIGFLNSDDWYEDDAICKIVDNFAPDVSVVSGQIKYIKNNRIEFETKAKSIECIWKEMPVMHPATFVRRELFNKYGLFDTGYKIAADYDFLFKLYINKVKIISFNDSIVNFSEGGVSTSYLIKTIKESNSIREKYYNNILCKEDIIKLNHIALETAYFNELISKKPGIVKDYIRKKVGINICVWGCGYVGEKIIDCLRDSSVNILCIFDNNPLLWEKSKWNLIIKNPDILKKDKYIVLIAAFDSKDIEKQLTRYENTCLEWASITDIINELKIFLED